MAQRLAATESNSLKEEPEEEQAKSQNNNGATEDIA
jgi:hypothetical protein